MEVELDFNDLTGAVCFVVLNCRCSKRMGGKIALKSQGYWFLTESLCWGQKCSLRSVFSLHSFCWTSLWASDAVMPHGHFFPSLALLSLHLCFSVPYSSISCFSRPSHPFCTLYSLNASAPSLRNLVAFFLKAISPPLLCRTCLVAFITPFLSLLWAPWQCECQRRYAHSLYAHKEHRLTGWLEINPTAWLWLPEWCSGAGSVPALRTDASTATVPPPQNPISPAKLSREEEEEEVE